MRSFGAGAAALLALGAQECAGHAYMTQPASRNAEAHNASPRTEFEPQSAGGGGGFAPCGKIAGHDYTDDAWNSAHAAGHQVVVKGGVLQTEVKVTAHHWGHFEFSMCDLDTLNLAGKSKSEKDALLWECFNKESNLLRRHADYEAYDPAPIDSANPTRWYLPPKGTTSWPPQGWTGAPASGSGMTYRMWLQVPAGVNCDGDNCLLFYFYYSSNSCEAGGYRGYMNGVAPPQVKDWFASQSDKKWTCSGCGLCADGGAEDGLVHNGKRAFDHTVSLGVPERFYGCADVSTVTGIAKAADLPAACPGAWCAGQTCSCDGQASTLAPSPPPATKSPTAAGATHAPSVGAVTASPTKNAADCQCSQAKSWCQAKCVARSNGVSMNQCWGTPTTFLQCRCSDGTDLTAQSIAESGSACQCLHADCPAPGPASTAAPSPPPATLSPSAAGATNAPVPATQAPTTKAPTTGAPTKSPTTASPQAAPSCGTCSSRAHDAAMISCGTCVSEYCHGNAIMTCPSGLVFNPAGFCNWPAAEGCQGNQGFAAARADAEGAKGSSSSVLVAVLGAAVAVLSGCVVALVVVVARGRKAQRAADGEPLSGVVGGGPSMRAGHAHQQLADERVKAKTTDV